MQNVEILRFKHDYFLLIIKDMPSIGSIDFFFLHKLSKLTQKMVYFLKMWDATCSVFPEVTGTRRQLRLNLIAEAPHTSTSYIHTVNLILRIEAALTLRARTVYLKLFTTSCGLASLSSSCLCPFKCVRHRTVDFYVFSTTITFFVSVWSNTVLNRGERVVSYLTSCIKRDSLTRYFISYQIL